MASLDGSLVVSTVCAITVECIFKLRWQVCGIAELEKA
jgi:hypothetical protein